jgi:hypothetical protein
MIPASRPSFALSLLLLLSAPGGCAHGDASSASTAPAGDACDEYQRVQSVCGAAAAGSPANDKAARARREILLESRGTPEARALMDARCEQLVAQMTANAECQRKLAQRQ